MATAAPATRWLLIEAPGPWGRQALRQSSFGAEVAAKLLEVSSEQGVRIQVIRRPPDRAHPEPSRRWAYVDSQATTPPISWWGTFEDDTELLDVSLDGSQGAPSAEPIFLVCTHARHDACCALLGRPAYSALAAAYPQHTWETSHVGGDRFAANVVILPHGFYYGGLDADSALGLVQTHLAGEIDPRYFRGASAQPVPTQAAEHYLRDYLGERGIDAILPLGLTHVDVSRWVVRMSHVGGAEFDVEVSTTHSAALTRLTCSASHPAAARLFELINLREVDRS